MVGIGVGPLLSREPTTGVTFKVENHFSKTSNFLNQNQNLAAEPTTGLPPNVALVVPIADQLRDLGRIGRAAQEG